MANLLQLLHQGEGLRRHFIETRICVRGDWKKVKEYKSREKVSDTHYLLVLWSLHPRHPLTR